MKNKKHLLLLLTILLPLAQVAAQNNPLSKEVEVTRAYDPTVLNAQKLFYDPTINSDSLKTKDAFTYSVTPRSLFGDFGLAPITSASLIEKNRDNNGLGYVRAAVGYPFAPLADFYISNNSAKSVLLGMYANHMSYWGKVTLKDSYGEKKVAADNMSNDIGVFAKKTFRNATLSVNADYSGKYLLLYGYPVEWYRNNTFVKADNKQTFNFFNTSALLESSTVGDDRIDYNLGISYQLFNDHYHMKENAFSIWGMLAKHLDENHAFSINLKTTSYSRNNLLDEFGNNLLVGVKPSYTYTNEGFTGRVGFQLVVDGYDGESKNRLYPALYASYHVADYFIPSLELKGETEANSYRKLASGCYYIQPGLEDYRQVTSQKFRNTYQNLVMVASIKGELGSAASYNLFGAYAEIDNLAMYINTPSPTGSLINPDFTNTLLATYDNGSKLSVGAEFQLDTDQLDVYAKIVYNTYSLDKFKEAIHLPALEGSIVATYKPNSQWAFSGSFSMATGRYYQLVKLPSFIDESRRQPEKLGNIFDVGVSVEYFITQKLSIFGSMSNVFNQRYDLFHQYTVPGLITRGGIAYRF